MLRIKNFYVKNQVPISSSVMVSIIHLAPLFQCMEPTPVMVPNLHSPELSLENISKHWIKSLWRLPEKYSEMFQLKMLQIAPKTCVVCPAKLVIGHVDNRPVAVGLPVQHLPLVPGQNLSFYNW